MTDASFVYLCTFLIISLWLLLRMKNVSDKICRQNQNKYFVLGDNFFFFQNRTLLWDSAEKFDTRGQDTDYNKLRTTDDLFVYLCTFLIISLSDFLEWKIFRAKFVDKIKINILYWVTIFFLFQNRNLLWDNAEKCDARGQDTDYNKVHYFY